MRTHRPTGTKPIQTVTKTDINLKPAKPLAIKHIVIDRHGDFVETPFNAIVMGEVFGFVGKKLVAHEARVGVNKMRASREWPQGLVYQSSRRAFVALRAAPVLYCLMKLADVQA